jgi:ABC-type oligopeptide transport system substrate-binding subunit
MRPLRRIALLAALALFSACGGEQGTNQNTTTLNLGIAAEPESLDAHKASSSQAAAVLRDIGEGLLSYTASGELTTGVAERWEISADGLSYTFYLRPTAKWSNGDAVVAADFVFAMRRLAAPETAAFYAQFLADVAAATAIDEHTLSIELRQPTSYLLSLLTHPATFPMHRASIKKHGERFAWPGNLLSNGAYVLDEWVPGSVIVLKRNTRYWNNAATAIDEVRHHVLTQSTTELARFRAGEIDATVSVPTKSFQLVREELGDQLRVAPYLGVYYYGFNLTKPPFKNNPKLRQALSLAIDREQLVEKVIGRGELPAYNWVPPGVSHYQAPAPAYASLSQAERNRRARRLYKEAGYSEEKPLHLELRYHTSDAEQTIALAVQARWREILGVRTTLVNEEFRVLLSNIGEREVTQVFRSSWTADFDDAKTFLDVLLSDNAANAMGYISAEYDALMQRAAAQADPDRRRLFLEEAERVMLADYPAIPLYFYVSKHLVSPRVSGWGDNVLDYHYSRHLSLKAAE